VLDLLNRPEARRRMGENGRRSVEHEFSRDSLARQWEAALERLVGSRRAA
jgi:glycosyltransferase involved in cell wall biosynthesis